MARPLLLAARYVLLLGGGIVAALKDMDQSICKLVVIHIFIATVFFCGVRRSFAQGECLLVRRLWT
jgi:hypothetical protein